MRVTGLFVYPLKSARGVPLDEVPLDGFGVAGDRRWSLLGPDDRVITQRDCPILATLDAVPTEDGIELRAPDLQTLRVSRPTQDAGRLSIEIWKDRTEGAAAGPEADSWLEAFLARPCRLSYMPNSTRRQVSLQYGRPGDHVSFADGFPLLLTSEASLAELNGRLGMDVPMDRFRPNLVVDGTEPFAEDDWARIRVADTSFRVVKPCARCVVTTVDQRTGKKGQEPLQMLATFRNSGGKVLFGQNLIHDGPGPIRVGDEVEVLEQRITAAG